MIKAHGKFKVPSMRRSSRVYLNDLNPGKAAVVKDFLRRSRDITQFFVDLFWQRQDLSAALADIDTVHRACDRFGISTRLAQALAKQAKEVVRSTESRRKDTGTRKRKPRLRNRVVTLYSHFVRVEPFRGAFDHALILGGAGVPKVVIPCKSTCHLNTKLRDGWVLGNTIRLGRSGDRLFVDFIVEKPRPALKMQGRCLGLDSNYKNGLTTSAGQFIGKDTYARIQAFGRRQKNTKAEIKSLMFHALKSLDLSDVRVLAIEDLRHVRSGTRGKFPRRLNRRMSHWLYGAYSIWLQQRCEESGIRLERKDPWKTSQRCAACGKWDRRSRKGDVFLCVFCGHSDHADLNSPKNLEALALAEVYGLRQLPNPIPYGLG